MRRWFITAIVLMALSPMSSLRAQEVGDRPPKLWVTDWITGNPDDVGEWGDGKVYILEFWGTWCAPCIKSIPHLTELQKTYKDRGLVVIGYSWEDAKTLRSFVKKMGDRMKYVVVGDTEKRTLEKFTIEGFPYTYLIDDKGVIVWRGHPKELTEVVSNFFKNRKSED